MQELPGLRIQLGVCGPNGSQGDTAERTECAHEPGNGSPAQRRRLCSGRLYFGLMKFQLHGRNAPGLPQSQLAPDTCQMPAILVVAIEAAQMQQNTIQASWIPLCECGGHDRWFVSAPLLLGSTGASWSGLISSVGFDETRSERSAALRPCHSQPKYRMATVSVRIGVVIILSVVAAPLVCSSLSPAPNWSPVASARRKPRVR